MSCQIRRLQALFVALNDEAGSMRALAISVVGRLASLNPGYILPAARKHLIQLLNDMEHSPDSRQRQGKLAVLTGVWTCMCAPNHFTRILPAADGNNMSSC